MRLTRRWQHRSRAGLIALATLSACALTAGCQGPPFEHVDGASTTFNANHIPTVDGQASAAASGSHAETSATAAGDSAKLPPQSSAVGNDALIVENLNLGHREAALNRLDQAEVYYRRVLEIQPNNATANHRLAVIADKNRDFARAEHYYLTALRRDARDPDLLSDLGYSYLLQGRREDSERCLLAATRLDPSHPKALHNLSLLYAMSGDYDRSFDALRRAVGEDEARVKIARLFPNGRPQSAKGDAMIASFQPWEPRDGGSPAPVDAAAVNSATADSTTATQMTAPQPATASSEPGTVATFDSNAAPPTAAPPARVPSAASGRVPDSEINEIFAAIDREPPQDQPAGSTVPAPAAVLPAPAGAPGAGSASSDTAPLQAKPGADPLASMPMWSPPAASLSPPQKSAAAFELDDAAPSPAPATQHPRAIATGIMPASDSSSSPRGSDQGDAMSQFEAELKKDKPANGGLTNSNGAIAREPLIVARPSNVPSGGGDQAKPVDDGTWPAPYGSAPPIRIEPRSNPAALFEPVEGFGPTNDFAPGDNGSTPAWPITNGSAAPPSGNATASGPVIRPRPSN
jgi:Flp pilus assembly protein TadD